jgi:hypothetical protein
MRKLYLQAVVGRLLRASPVDVRVGCGLCDWWSDRAKHRCNHDLGCFMAYSYRQYHDARQEHIFLLRCEGMKYGEIASRLGLNVASIGLRMRQYGRRLYRAIKRSRWTIDSVTRCPYYPGCQPENCARCWEGAD